MRVGALDQIPIRDGQTAAESIAETIELAQTAEHCGYHRYWLAEHHNTGSLACSSPEVLIPLLGRTTSSIRIGAGGIMLSHYSPFKVAECFSTLETLFPGRVDLGLGRAPGSDQRTASALAYGQPRGPDLYPRQVADLLGILNRSLPEDSPLARLRATPTPDGVPEVWLLGSGMDSALLAARLGCAYSHAHFIQPETTAQALELYRREFRPGMVSRPTASAGVSVTCAPTAEEAERISKSRALWWIKILRGQPGPFPSVEDAESFDYTDSELAMLRGMRRRGFLGTAQTVAKQLTGFVDEHGLDEAMVLTITYDPAHRVRSYRDLAAALGLRDRRRKGGESDPGSIEAKASTAGAPSG